MISLIENITKRNFNYVIILSLFSSLLLFYIYVLHSPFFPNHMVSADSVSLQLTGNNNLVSSRQSLSTNFRSNNLLYNNRTYLQILSMLNDKKFNQNNINETFNWHPIEFSKNYFKNMEYNKFFINSETNFLPLDPIHSPFNFESIIDNISALPIAYGDFDADRYTDIFLLADNGTTISLLKGHHCVDGKTILTFFGSRRCLSVNSNFQCKFPLPIYNLVTSDFTGQVHQDLLITIKSNQSISNNYKSIETYDIILVKGDMVKGETKFNCSQQKLLVQNAFSEPFILDYNGDIITDFIVETKQCPLLLVLGGSFDQKNQFICLKNLSKITKLSKPHASGFMNLNSHLENMTPDIFINGEMKFEYIYNEPGKGFKNGKIYEFPQHLLRGQSTFADIDYDGKLEHLIPVCLQNASSFVECETPGIMMFNDDDLKWTNILFVNGTFGQKFNRTLTFVETTCYDYIQLPVTLHGADINYDGFTDIVTVLLDKEQNKTVGAIILNRLDSKTQKRIFDLEWIGEYENNVILISVFDIFNNGRSNLIMTTRNSTSNELKLEVYDYYVEKSLYFSFLRVNILSGLCSDKYPSEYNCSHLPYGSSPPGANVCFQGSFPGQYSCLAQSSQTAHFSLQPPYMIFGLGDVLNVINDLNIAIPNGNQTERIHKWNDIIPGSKLVIVPYKPNEMNIWEIRVFINMSIYSMFALLFLLVLCLILILAIIILHFREKREDRIDIQQYRNTWL